MLPVGAVTEEDAASRNLLSGSLEGCFSCNLDPCQLIQREGLVARISSDYEPQLPVVGEDIPGPAVPCHVGTAWLLEMMDRRTSVVGRDF